MAVTAIFTNRVGVGRSLLTANLAAEMAAAGASVAVVDLDPHAALSELMLEPEQIRDATSISDIMAPVVRSGRPIADIRMSRSKAFGADVLPCSSKLALLEDFLATEWSAARAGMVQGVRSTLALRSAVRKVSENYDEVLINCGPSLGSLTRSGLLAADRFFSPVALDRWSVDALSITANWMLAWGREWTKISASLGEAGSSSPTVEGDLPIFEGYVVVHNDRRPRDEQAENDLAQAASDAWIGAGRLGEVSWAATSVAVQSHRVPFSKLEQIHGLVGQQFAERTRAARAHADIGRQLLARDSEITALSA